jgi:hypothetical protein
VCSKAILKSATVKRYVKAVKSRTAKEIKAVTKYAPKKKQINF